MTRLTSSISCLLAALLAIGASAANITVTSTADSGQGSLRQAITDATAGQEIDFAPGLSGQTITLTSGELVINKNLTVTGLGADQLTVSGNNNSRIFAVVGPVIVQISGLTLTDGNGAGTLPTSNGGAILNDGGTLTVSGCVLFDNSGVNGGAVFVSSGTLNVDQSTVFGNNSANGGGIVLFSGTMTVSQSTLFDNSATFNGGAIFVDDGLALVEQSTLAGNSAVNGGAIYLNGGMMNLNLTILANSAGAGNFDFEVPGQLNSLDYNLSDDNSAAAYLTGAGDLNNTPAGLDPNGLQNNGGPTRTIALEMTSAAIDAGDPAFTPPPSSDQRGAGFPRVLNSIVDIGAFEFNPNTPPTAVCPAPSSAECTSGEGATVSLTVQVGDADGNPLTVIWFADAVPVQTNYVPAGGPPTSANVTFTGTFGFGLSTVDVSVSDGLATPVSCSTTVTVVEPRQVKIRVRDDLVALRASATSDLSKFDAAINYLNKSIDPNRWLNDSHPKPGASGDGVFSNEKSAVSQLLALKPNYPAVQGLIDRLVLADRIIAEIAIKDAIARGGSTSKITAAQNYLQKGDTYMNAGKPTNAIDQYKNAWKSAIAA